MRRIEYTLLMSGIIYCYTSPSGKQYIGQTWEEKRRKYFHQYVSSECYAMKHAVAKYGYENLKYEVLHSGLETQEEMDRLEILEIKERNSLAPHGYNLTTGGSRGRWSEESKKRLSEKQRGTKRSEETKRKMSLAQRGRKCSDESRKRMSDAQKALNRTLTDEHKRKLSEANKGKIVTDETRSKISAFHKGRKKPPLSADARRKIGEASSRHRHSEETKAKMSAWQIGGKFSEERKLNISKSLQKTAVRCVETGIEYPGVTEAERLMGRKKGAIYHAIKKGGKCAGYHWEYI